MAEVITKEEYHAKCAESIPKGDSPNEDSSNEDE